MTLRNSLISLLLIISMGLSFWSVLVSNKSKPTHSRDNSHSPDALMEDVVAMIMNKQGILSLKLTTPRMIHYAKDDATEIQKPTVTIYHNSPNPWYINSDYAKATQGISQILFWSHVVISHPADKLNPFTTMQTSTLTVFPEKQTAETDQAVIIRQPDTTVQATGMLANMNDGTVQLLKEAKGEYVPAT